MSYNPDPRLVRAIKTEVPKALQPVILATALQESGGRTNAVGDNGNSHGAYQENRYGRGAGIPVSSSQDPVASTRRALKEFQAFYNKGYRGAELAYAAQRPADKGSYVAGVNAKLADAQKILGMTPTVGGGVEVPGTNSTQATTVAGTDSSLPQTIALSLASNARSRKPGGLFRAVFSAAASASQNPTAAATSATGGKGVAHSEDDGHNHAAQFGGDGKAVKGSPRLIGSPYSGTHTLGNWQSDNAVDISIPEGTPIYAIEDGTIGSRIGPLGAQTGGRFDGNRLTLEGSGNAYYYAHLKSLAVKAGQRVKKGQLLGYSGKANGVPHLHLGVQKSDPRRFA